MSILNVGAINLTNGMVLPEYTTANLPQGEAGLLVFDSTAQKIRVHDGVSWKSLDTGASATGGTVTNFGGYKIHTFTATATLTVTSPGIFEYLIIGGGGAGGAGGGGAGGVLQGTIFLPNNTYAIQVGGAGAKVSSGARGQAPKGGDCTQSSAFGLISYGGGGGSQAGTGNASGAQSGHASGGGQGGDAINVYRAQGITPQGNNGGRSGRAGYGGHGGGGGSGSAGQDGPNEAGDRGRGGHGGVGIPSAISGTAQFYGGGGGGCSNTNSNATNGGGVGGKGGGGQGALASDAGGSAALINTGGGGGGAEYEGSIAGGGNGGSGIVIIRYKG